MYKFTSTEEETKFNKDLDNCIEAFKNEHRNGKRIAVKCSGMQFYLRRSLSREKGVKMEDFYENMNKNETFSYLWYQRIEREKLYEFTKKDENRFLIRKI